MSYTIQLLVVIQIANPVSTHASGIGARFLEILTGGLMLYILYQYIQLRSAQSPADRRVHHRRLVQSIFTLGGLVYLGSLFAPTVDAWPIRLGLVVRDSVQSTAARINHLLRGGGFRARVFQVGIITYSVILTLIALGVRVPVIIWNAIVGE